MYHAHQVIIIALESRERAEVEGESVKRILIAEDEFLVRIGLKTTMDWAAHGYTIVGEAANGKEALQLFGETHPDILITDVKMPVMGGLELVSEAKKRKRDLQVVILSNYNDFEYAREFMRLGASRYLLKSEISEQSLLRALESLDVPVQGEAELDGGLRARQERFLRNYFGASMEENQPLPAKASEARNVFPSNHYLAMRCDGDFEPTEETDEETVIKNVESLFHSALENAVYCSGIMGGRLRVSVVCPAPEGPGGEVGRFRRKCGMILRNAKNYFDVELHIGISEVREGRNIARLFSQAEEARIGCFFANQPIRTFAELPPRVTAPAPKVSSRKILGYIDGADPDGMKKYIADTFSRLLPLRNFSDVRTVYIDFLSIAKSVCEEKNIDLADGLSGTKFSYDNLTAIPCLKNVQDYVGDLYSAVFKAVMGGDDYYSHTIRQCLEYIGKNYASNISLDNMAQAVNISKSYLSMIFKQETGINFITYLTRYRVERAKELLLRTNMKIYEIADKVGFSSPYYFSKVFKDWTNLSCKEYKDRNTLKKMQR